MKIQTDNSYLSEKVQLRIESLPKKDVVYVLECFAGDGLIWKEVKRITKRNIKILRIDQWDAISDEYRDKMLDVIKRTPQHQYQVLTKRPKKMAEYFTTRKVPSNFWCGVTIEDQANKERLGYLKQVDAEIRFISMEPLISPVFFEDDDLEGIHWIITGGESGLHLFKEDVRLHRSLVNLDIKTRKWTPREDRMDWIRMIRDACTSSGVKFFHKQWGGHKPESAGRMLDGRTWNEMPRLPGTDTEIQNGYLKLLEARKEVTL